MTQFINQFIGKDCIISTMDSQITGIINEENEGWISITGATGTTEIINLEYVLRIREYPKNKNGKKKTFVD